VKVLMSAYACEPDKGSEPGAGWNWVLAAARNHDVWVMTRANNRDAIEASLARDPVPSLRFEYLDLPAWARFWKRGPRGVRLYYLLWQALAGRRARQLHAQHRFDVVHHITFANVWLPALVWRAKAPFVLGPVGGGPRVPLGLYRILGLRGAARELLLVAGRALSRLNPLARAGWRRAAVILVQNEETSAALPRRYRARTLVRPNASATTLRPPDVSSDGARGPVAIYAGRLLPWKGVTLAVRALEHLPRWTLLIVGRGPDEGRIKDLTSRLGLEHRVRCLPWLPREDLWSVMGACSALVLPSLREDASLVAAEAQSLGLPVVAFDQGGPAALAHATHARFELVPLGAAEECVTGLARALGRVEEAPPPSTIPDFGLRGISEDLDRVYGQLAGTTPAANLEVSA